MVPYTYETTKPRKLVIAIDIGTTFSGVSYCLLEPGQQIEIRDITRYPGREDVGRDYKIPTVIWYDKDGNIQAAGAEATREGIEVEAVENEWSKAEWFKVYFRPAHVEAAVVSAKVPPLPVGKTVVEVFADFLRYIFQCARAYITESYPNGQSVWDNVENEIQFVLTHPNGYEGHQQELLRQAAVLAGLVPDQNAAKARVALVTEGESCLHFCVDNGLTVESSSRNGVMIIDAGGGTIDFSSYVKNGDSFAEIAASQCIYNGSVYVTLRAKAFLQNLLKGSRFEQDVDAIASIFDKRTKPSFRNPGDKYVVRFGTMQDIDVKLHIKNGQLRLHGLDIESFFIPSVEDIIRVVQSQPYALEGSKITTVFLVGGFASSDYIYNSLKRCLIESGIEVYRPDSNLNKAVAQGAVSYYLNHWVKTRVSKYTFGVPCSVRYHEEDEEHARREHTRFFASSGVPYLPGAFEAILQRNTQVSETTEFRRPFARTRDSIEELKEPIEIKVLCYRGLNSSPRWLDTEHIFSPTAPLSEFTSLSSGMFPVMCTITADLHELCDKLQPRVAFNERGDEKRFYRIDFEIALLFGLTIFQAVVMWRDAEGAEHRTTPAQILFSEKDAIPIQDNTPLI